MLASQVLTCDFYHEQAWELWLNAKKNGARMIKEVMLCKFRCVAKTRNKEELKNALNNLRNCDYWMGGYEHLVNWFAKQWIPLIKAYLTDILVAYRKDIIYISHINSYIIYKLLNTLYYLYKLSFT